MTRYTALAAVLLLAAACGSPADTPGAATPVTDTPATSTPAPETPGTPTETPAGPASPPGEGASPPASPDDGSPAAGESPAATPPAESPEVPEGSYVNPVLDVNFPDPHVIEVDGTYYAYATQGRGFNIQMSVSEDMVTWSRPQEALPRLPLWTRGDTWAPEVAETSAGFVMYYTLRASGTPRPDRESAQCVSFAVADSPEGPFVDENEEPFVCQPGIGGSIDPHHFVDEDGTPYLVWKNDGNCCSISTRMWIQELNDDGTELIGEAVDMGVLNDQRWEGHVIEAPTVLLQDDTYYLFYSANDYNSEHYAVGFAMADSVEGPYTESDRNPILSALEPAAGPGGQAVIEDANGELWMYYHAWDPAVIGDHRGGARSMWLSPLRFEDGEPVIDGPEIGPQPAPEPASE